MRKSFVYRDEKSHKFWNISEDGSSFTVCYGKAGTTGQEQTKTFESPERRAKESEKLVSEKLKK